MDIRLSIKTCPALLYLGFQLELICNFQLGKVIAVVSWFECSIWYGMVWHGMVLYWYGMAWVWHDMIAPTLRKHYLFQYTFPSKLISVAVLALGEVHWGDLEFGT